MRELIYCYGCKIKIPSKKFSRYSVAKVEKSSIERGEMCKLCNYRARRQRYQEHPEIRLKHQERAKRYGARYYERHRWTTLVRGATKRGLGFLDYEQFLIWYKNQNMVCVYCGINQEAAKVIFGKNLEFDRKDNSIGYRVENMALACRRCNTIKGKWFSYDEMKKVAEMFIIPKLRGNRLSAT